MVFSEEVRPFGKAGPRKKTNSRKRKSEILTDTPVKAALAKQKSQSLTKKLKRKPKDGKKAVRKLTLHRDKKLTGGLSAKCMGDQDSDYACAVCGELFSDSRPGEMWTQCVAESCDNWAHELCSDDSGVFICPTCEDDD